MWSKIQYSIKLSVFLLLIFNSNFKVNAQWLFHCGYSIQSQPPVTATAIAKFISEDTAVFAENTMLSHTPGTQVYTTTDRGQNLLSQFGGSDNLVYDIIIVKKQNSFYVIHFTGIMTAVKRYIDGGLTWAPIASLMSEGASTYSIPDTSKIFSFRNGYPDVMINKYSNGITNNNYAIIPDVYARDVFFPDSLTGYLIADSTLNNSSNGIMKTIDGGQNWQFVHYDTALSIIKLFFTSQDNGYCIVYPNRVLHTSDGGMNWNLNTIDTSLVANSLYFINDSTGFVVGNMGKIFRTYDYGVSWSQDAVNTNMDFYEVYFINDTIGFATANGITYRINLNSLIGVSDLENNSIDAMKIFPNPSDDITHFYFESVGGELDIYDQIGQLEIRKRILEQDINIELKNGIYYCKLIKDNTILSVKRLIIISN